MFQTCGKSLDTQGALEFFIGTLKDFSGSAAKPL